MVNPLSGLDSLIFMKIDHSVGKGGSNRRDDVQRIQFMLNVIHLDPGNDFRMASLLAMDGICGPMTLAAILAYQTYKQDKEFPLLVVDGLVSATHAFLMTASGAGFSTLYNLNMDYMMGAPRANFMALGMYVAEPFFSDVILPLQKAGVI